VSHFGDHAGKEVFIQRINIDPSEESLPFKLYRLQFPIHLAFVMTIKGNPLSMLCTPVFSHGQLYVALSRCTSPNNIKVLFPDGFNTTSTSNIVYPEVLSGLI
jgi:hypothetical protein